MRRASGRLASLAFVAVLGRQEIGEVVAQLIMTVAVEAFDRGVLDGSFHSLDLALGPRVVGLGQGVLNSIGFTDHVETHLPRIDCVPVPGQLSELDAIIGQNSVNLVWHGLEHMLEKLPSGAPVSLFNELGHGELTGSVDSHEEVKLALSSLHLRNIDVEEPNRVAFEFLTPGLVPLDIR